MWGACNFLLFCALFFVPFQFDAMSRRVSLIYSSELVEVCDHLPANLGKASLIYDLLTAHGYLQESADHPNLRVIPSLPSTSEDLKRFHDSDFIG